MNENSAYEMLRRELQKRRNDDGWNYAIAGRVVTRRKKNMKIKTIAGAGAMAGALAVLCIALFIANPEPSMSYGMHSLISEQVNGAYGDVFTMKGPADPPAAVTYVYFGATDSIIDNALNTR